MCWGVHGCDAKVCTGCSTLEMRRLSALAGPAERVEVGAPSSASVSGPKRQSKKKKRKKKPKKLPDLSLIHI